MLRLLPQRLTRRIKLPIYRSSSPLIGPEGAHRREDGSRQDGDQTRLLSNSRILRTALEAQGDPITPSAVARNVAVTESEKSSHRQRPIACPGCGALSQTVDPTIAGYYDSTIKTRKSRTNNTNEDDVLKAAIESGAAALAGLTADHTTTKMSQAIDLAIPVCSRCHDLLHQSRGTSIIHPSMQSIRQIIEDSPHKHNHIYHVLDAADFPMSLIPNLQHALRLPNLRAHNRRAKTVRYTRGRIADVSFIITRADLLAPKKEQVDRLLPYLREVLRDALGRAGRNVRLGNVRCVSARRGWWTIQVKEEIWGRGGAGWMVGKVNVGKSALFEGVFPKGRNQSQQLDVRRMQQERSRLENPSIRGSLTKTDNSWDGVEARSSKPEVLEDMGQGPEDDAPSSPTLAHESLAIDGKTTNEMNPFSESRESFTHKDENHTSLDSNERSPRVFEPESCIRNLEKDEDEDYQDEDIGTSLLPPLQKETAYPQMPIVSSLPGTTASPIRVPFGNGKGELIDLPGVERSSLSELVRPQFHRDLLMKSRVKPEKYTIKPGQSLLIGGMFRITPKTEDLVVMAYPFVPLYSHVTSTAKAIGIQTGFGPDGEPYSGTVQSVSTEEAKQHIRQAGTYRLQHDVTKSHTGPLTDPVAGKQKASNLPFIVYSSDILFEGLGWIELVCQVRKRRQTLLSDSFMDAFSEVQFDSPDTVKSAGSKIPEVEIWSPEGKFVGIRRPMNAWLVNGPKKVAASKHRARPRQSISMQRRREGGARNQ